MAGDSNYLEKMGRELKCPICLSLLQSAVSLNCNHIFCNPCIVKSMKSDSNCPVCKVPYHRREVRPAPHMDNLVSIYKSMEISSGMNIFITQNAPSGRLSDGKMQVEDFDNQDREQGSQEDSVHVRPSFPTKKRVQVPQTQSEGCLDDTVVKLPEKSSKFLKSDTNERGEHILSPFFWLRDEENVENLSQLSAKSPFDDMPLPNIPTFSDIKDSDDENSSRLTPDREENGKPSNFVEKFDSEMFEWTQRACSPELCSSPFKTRVDDIDVVQENESTEAANGKKRINKRPTRNVKFVTTKQDDRSANETPNISPPGSDNTNTQVAGKKSRKRGRKAREPIGNTCTVKNANLTLEINPEEKAQELVKTCKRNKKAHLSDIGTKPVQEIVSAAVIAETPHDLNKSVVAETLASVVGRRRRDNIADGEKICAKDKLECSARLGKRFDTKEKNSGEASNGKNLMDEDTIAQLSALLVPLANKDKASISGGKQCKLSGKSKTSDGLKSKRKSKVSTSSGSRNDEADDIQDGCVNNIWANEAQNPENIENKTDTGSLADPLVAKKLPSLTSDAVLQRCENNLSKIQCAFCLSSEVSEASGEMVHYFNGKPVAVDYNGGSKVIHSHRNCTEWAPNVYFDDGVAINLEAELTRSRRIKCSCCGIKGAALGCYDKSCRKSFHVPCAKLMPQCRWDMDNFVMLCPLHPSNTFPSECSETQAKKPKRSTKKLSCVQHNKAADNPILGISPNWSSCGASKKMVLCCSALTNSEREIVSEFERVSGVTVSKKWESNVTHVIASTDENGASKRTLKVLMGILDGKWILRIKWVQACIEAMKLVDEKSFEITVDAHGIRDGPQLGRLRVQNKLPKLFEGFKFYFMGEFVASYKGYLQELITCAGGTILQRKPVSGNQNEGSLACHTFIIYSLELSDQSQLSKMNAIFDHRRIEAETLASSSGAKVVSNSWVLNSIAACKLQNLNE